MSLLLRRRVMASPIVIPHETDDPIIIVGSSEGYDSTDRRQGIYAFGWDLSTQRHHYYAENVHFAQAFAYNNDASFFMSRPAHIFDREDIRRLQSSSVANRYSVAEAFLHQQTIINQDDKFFVRPRSSVDVRRVRVFSDTSPFTEITGFPQVASGHEIWYYIANPWDNDIVGVIARDSSGHMHIYVLKVSTKEFIYTKTPAQSLALSYTGFFRHYNGAKEIYICTSTSYRGYDYEDDTEATWSGLRGVGASDINYNKTLLGIGDTEADGRKSYSIWTIAGKSLFTELPAVSGTSGRAVKWISNRDLLIGTNASAGSNALYHFDVWNYSLVSHTNYVSNVGTIDCPVPADPPSSPPVDQNGIYASSDFLTMDMIN